MAARRQASARKDWVFTLNNYTDDEVGILNGVLEDATKCRYGVYGREVGESGTPHLQGFVQFVNRKRPNQVSALLGIRRLHCEARRGTPDEAATYCKKDGDFIEFGQMSRPGVANKLQLTEMVESRVAGCDSDKMMEDDGGQYVMHKRKVDDVAEEIMKNSSKKKVEHMFTGAVLRPWQEALEEYLRGDVDSRSIIWCWEPIGNVGKSWFATYCAVKHDAIVFGNGKSADIKYAYRGQRIVIFDLSRTQMERVNYQVIEDIKNGRYFSSKYVSEMRVYAPPHVVCFSNSEPQYGALSADRWVLLDITTDSLDVVLESLFGQGCRDQSGVSEVEDNPVNYYGSPIGRIEDSEELYEENEVREGSALCDDEESSQRDACSYPDAVRDISESDSVYRQGFRSESEDSNGEMGNDRRCRHGNTVITNIDDYMQEDIESFYNILNF